MKRRLFTTYAILLLLGTILTGLLSLSFIKINYIGNAERMLQSNGSLINGFIEGNLEEEAFEDINFPSLAKRFSQSIGARVTFIDVTGNVIGDSEIERENLRFIENHLDRPEIIRALKGDIGRIRRFSTTVEIDYLYVAIPIIKDNTIRGVTRLAYPLDEIEEMLFSLIMSILIAALIGLIVAILIGYRYINRVTEPINQLISISENITLGKFNKRVYVDTNDEMELLANTFNNMSETLSKNIKELQDKNTKLKSVLSSMREGLIAIDSQKKIILINSPAKALFNTTNDDIIGEYIENTIKNQELKEAVENIIYNNIFGEREVIVNQPSRKTLKVYSDTIRLDENPKKIIGTLILIQDITEMRKLERMRTEFVANVSHELKTPLTSILGFIETLKNGAIENENVRGRFLDIIEIETERLTRLIDDLLTLSNIESTEMSFSRKEGINISSVIYEINQMMEKIAKSKDIEYSYVIQENLPSLYGSRDWFKQMVLNLVDNAIKYTPEGGKVIIKSYREDKDIFVVVKDTGIGIPQKDIPRLFERFYRVDKARSRKVGGTGLGLAIVKHIVIAFKGDIIVKSQENKGSEFIVRIPINPIE